VLHTHINGNKSQHISYLSSFVHIQVWNTTHKCTNCNLVPHELNYLSPFMHIQVCNTTHKCTDCNLVPHDLNQLNSISNPTQDSRLRVHICMIHVKLFSSLRHVPCPVQPILQTHTIRSSMLCYYFLCWIEAELKVLCWVKNPIFYTFSYPIPSIFFLHTCFLFSQYPLTRIL